MSNEEMTSAALDADLATNFTGGAPELTLKEYRWVIEEGIRNQPRSKQTRIGPSEIGNPCQHCLAAKLAGWDKNEDGIPWLPTVGTAVHAYLEDTFEIDNLRYITNTGKPRWLIEQKVDIGEIGDTPITGSTDLFDTYTGMVLDHKIVGVSTLNKARRTGPSPVYRTQAHSYGRGWKRAGYNVTNVAICYLPRNDVTLDKAVYWHEPFNEQIAIDALTHVNQLNRNLTALESVSPDARDAWITTLPRAASCWDCARYPDGAGLTLPGHAAPQDGFAGLLPQ
jgi:hypothetical protein